MAEYMKANAELIALISDKNFNSARAEEIISAIDDLNAPVSIQYEGLSGDFMTTYLYEAQEENNIAAVEFFLSHGADPNYINDEQGVDNGLWDLQYFTVDNPTEEDVQLRYEIAKLYFKYGADPNLTPESESLYYYVEFKVFNDSYGLEFDMLLNLYKLLIIYGGGVKEHTIDTSSIDYSRVDEYNVVIGFKENEKQFYWDLFGPDGLIAKS